MRAPEGLGFNPAGNALTHHDGKHCFPVVSPLPRGEGTGVRAGEVKTPSLRLQSNTFFKNLDET
ncbi:MAG: hypothetical protein ACRD18_11765 [Terriglobia bacterium]